jgi:hypothetical protein
VKTCQHDFLAQFHFGNQYRVLIVYYHGSQVVKSLDLAVT